MGNNWGTTSTFERLHTWTTSIPVEMFKYVKHKKLSISYDSEVKLDVAWLHTAVTMGKVTIELK